MASTSKGRTLRRSRPDSILGKTLLAYHGWYTCPGDGNPLYQGHHGWHKWFEQPIPAGGHPRFDLWPDVSSYNAKELYEVPGLTLPTSNGEPAKLFSSRNPATTKRHFHLMAEHGIDGVFLMRNANEISVDNDAWSPLANLMRISDEILDGVRLAAEAEGRVWALMYDITAVPPDKLAQVIRHDWGRLVVHKRLLNSPSYLREQGRPVIGIKGIGIKGAYQDPAVIVDIVRQLRTFTPGGAYIVAGVSANWRTPFEGDNDGNPGFAAVHREVDAINPWSVGKCRDVESADWYAVDMREDIKLIKKWNEETIGKKRIDYIPIVLPGVSRGNLYSDEYYNEIPRKSGTFLWRQVYHCQREGAHSLIIASFDDLNSGTAVLPLATLGRLLPNERRFLAMDADGDTSLPSDWYLRICGMAGEAIRGEKRIATDLMPKKELDDYWAMRPKYEDDGQYVLESSSAAAAAAALAYGGGSSMAGSSAEGSSSGAGPSGPSQPMRAGTIDFDNLAPPPPAYSLVDDGPEQITAEPQSMTASSQAPAPAPPNQAPAAPTPAPAPATIASAPTRLPTLPTAAASTSSAPLPAPSSEPAVVIVPAPSLNRPPTPIGASGQQRPGPVSQPSVPSTANSSYGQPSAYAQGAGLAAGMNNLSLGSSPPRPAVLGSGMQSASPPSQLNPLPNTSYGGQNRPWSPGQQSSSAQPSTGAYPQPQVGGSTNAPTGPQGNSSYGAPSNSSYGGPSNSSYGTHSNSSYGAPSNSSYGGPTVSNSSYGVMPGPNSNSTYGSMDSSFGGPSASGRPAQTEPGFTMPGHGPTRMDSSGSIGGFASPDLVRINSGRVQPPPMHPNRPGGRPAPVASSPFAQPAASSPFATPSVPGGYNPRPPHSPPIPGAARPSTPGSYPLPGESSIHRPNAGYASSPFAQPSSAGPGTSQFPAYKTSPQPSPGPTTAPLPSNSSYSSYGQPTGPSCSSQPSGPSSSSGPNYPGGSHPAAPGPSANPNSTYGSAPSAGPGGSSFSTPANSMFPSTSPGPSNRPPGGCPQPDATPLPGRQDSTASSSSTVMPTPKPFGGIPNNLFNPAKQAFDKYAGEDRRKQFEKGVDQAFQMGSKWLGKFGK